MFLERKKVDIVESAKHGSETWLHSLKNHLPANIKAAITTSVTTASFISGPQPYFRTASRLMSRTASVFPHRFQIDVPHLLSD